MKNKIKKFLDQYYLYFIFIISLFGTFGSIYFSDIINLEPCPICWYLRWLMYPLLVLSASAIFFKKKLPIKFILSLTIPAMLLSGYQYTLQMTQTPSVFTTCGSATCTGINFSFLGFIIVPVGIILLVSFITKTHLSTKLYVPLIVTSTLLAIYQFVWQNDLTSNGISCVGTAPCQAIDLIYAGFLTIPFLAFLAFTMINITSIIYILIKKN